MEQETNQDAQQDITSQGKPPQVLSILGFFLILVIILAGLGAVGFLALKAKNLPEGKLTDFSKALFSAPSLAPSSTVYTQTSNQSTKTNYEGVLQDDIRTTLVDSKNQDIVDLFYKASIETDLGKKYENYKTAYAAALTAYSKTKDERMQAIILDTYVYVKTLPNYKQDDFAIPK